MKVHHAFKEPIKSVQPNEIAIFDRKLNRLKQ
jgi:hypothetical protein